MAIFWQKIEVYLENDWLFLGIFFWTLICLEGWRALELYKFSKVLAEINVKKYSALTAFRLPGLLIFTYLISNFWPMGQGGEWWLLAGIILYIIIFRRTERLHREIKALILWAQFIFPEYFSTASARKG